MPNVFRVRATARESRFWVKSLEQYSTGAFRDTFSHDSVQPLFLLHRTPRHNSPGSVPQCNRFLDRRGHVLLQTTHPRFQAKSDDDMEWFTHTQTHTHTHRHTLTLTRTHTHKRTRLIFLHVRSFAEQTNKSKPCNSRQALLIWGSEASSKPAPSLVLLRLQQLQ